MTAMASFLQRRRWIARIERVSASQNPLGSNAQRYFPSAFAQIAWLWSAIVDADRIDFAKTVAFWTCG